MALSKINGDYVNSKTVTSATNVPQTDENKVSVFYTPPERPQNTPSDSYKIDKEFDTVCKNVSKKLDNIPMPYSLLGGKKIKQETMQILDDPSFRAGVSEILVTAKNSKPENANKNIIELARDKATFDKLLAYARTNSEKSPLLKTVLKNSSMEGQLYDYIKSDAALEFLKYS